MSGFNRLPWREEVFRLCDHVEFLHSAVGPDTERDFNRLNQPKGYGVTQTLLDYIKQHEEAGCTALSAFDLVLMGTGPSVPGYELTTPEVLMIQRGWYFDPTQLAWRR